MKKINRLINEGISKGVYVIEENDNTLTQLKSFQNFIYRNFKKHEKYKEMRPTSSQPARLFATAKTHKFTDIKQININDLKLRPIIDQTGTHLYDCSKIIAQYLQPLAINEYTISENPMVEYLMPYEPPKQFILKQDIYLSCNIYLKPERFRKSKFTLSKVRSESLFRNGVT